MKINKPKALIISLSIAAALQVLPTRDLETSTNNPHDLIATETIPSNITNMLKNACYDCHSQETKTPWYQKVIPIKWFINGHVFEGRKHLNFSNWNTLNKVDKASVLDDISDVVTEKEMPLKSYTLMHPDAVLSDTDREKISNWASEYAEDLFE